MASITGGLSDGGFPARPDEAREEFEIDLAPIWPVDDARLEPIFLAGPPSGGFEEFDPALLIGAPGAPLVADVEEVPRLDPERSAEALDEPPPAPRQRASAISHFGSLGLHLLVLLGLVNWSNAPAGIPNAMPVRLAFEESPSAPDETPPDRPAAETVSQTPRETPATADRTAADTAPSPPPRPPPIKTASVMPPPPKPSPSPKPSPPPEAAAHSEAAASKPAPREARVPGPDPARSDYLDHLVALTRHHLDMLPLSFLAGRRGQTILSIVVLEDGTIGRIALKRSSGYPDIDARIEEIVAAVGRFPPLPEAFERPSVELDFNLTFPNALQ